MGLHLSLGMSARWSFGRKAIKRADIYELKNKEIICISHNAGI